MVLSVVLMVADARYHHLHAVRAWLSTLVYPLQLLANSPMALSNWVWDTFTSRERLAQDNHTLKLENLRLRAQQQRFAALEEENMRLRDLLESSLRIGERVLVAELVAVDLDPYKQQVMIDKGSNLGVFSGQAVLDANAVMGQVVQVNPFTAQVLMITDASHALPVQLNRNGLRSIALGTGRINELELAHLPNNADIRVGDLVITSGLGGHFPSGYPVGEVTSVTRTAGKPFARVLVRPHAHLERIREVMLVWSMEAPTAPPPDAQGGLVPSPVPEAKPEEKPAGKPEHKPGHKPAQKPAPPPPGQGAAKPASPGGAQ